ncbi:adenosylcobinamide-phosphate guanylyltransferase [Methanocaldococcus fervens]|uniref:GTP:adenosylcobinamide-phosphate guanylyltransferase-like protein n=1 Tax=Methanocaldococcus fervens (strain DSM 4213 / JCM 15782 / AG86) TaxID=573064 RepID=C7P6F5_METFA|nr:adenosylcobinamide-phosphate guanylyltransferase [Methanocaldococcus fervens]ACV24137.1 GTP:adenosylcobinamide-phosphate guanylyltransferase-like protein [Methanocaldococcus fervens AG86]
MDALVMAGGKGTRMGNVEKPIVKVCGKCLIDYVLYPLLSSKVKNIFVAVSPNTPKTKEYVIKNYCDYKNISVVETSGKDYINDLNECMKYFSEPFLVVSSDLINLTSKIINSIVDYFYYIKSKNPDVEAIAVMLPKKIYPNPSIDFNGLVPVGINVVSPKHEYQKEEIMAIEDLIFNINTKDDLKFAEMLLKNQQNSEG